MMKKSFANDTYQNMSDSSTMYNDFMKRIGEKG